LRCLTDVVWLYWIGRSNKGQAPCEPEWSVKQHGFPADFNDAFPDWVRFVRGEITVTRFRGAPPSRNLAEDDVNPVCRTFQADVRLESPTYLRLATVSRHPGLAASPVSRVKRSRTKRVCNVGTRVAQSDCRVLTPRCEPSRRSRPSVACGSDVTCSLKQRPP
jgi:hypothetical protein